MYPVWGSLFAEIFSWVFVYAVPHVGEVIDGSVLLGAEQLSYASRENKIKTALGHVSQVSYLIPLKVQISVLHF